MAGVGNYRQVRAALRQRDRVQVHGVARGRLEGADAALAQDHIRVALGNNVLGAQQPFLNRGREAALEQRWHAGTAHLFEQLVVLHVARTNLQHIGVACHQRNISGRHHLGHDWQASFGARLCHKLQRLFAHAPEGVR